MSTNRYNLTPNLATGWDIIDARTSLIVEMPPGTPLRRLRRAEAEELCHLMNINLDHSVKEPEGNSRGRSSADES